MGSREEEEEAVNHREFALVDNWPEAVRCVHGEVGDCHFTGGDERGDSSEQPEGDQQPGAKFDDPGDHHLGMSKLGRTSQYAEQLLRAVTGEEKPKDDTCEAEG